MNTKATAFSALICGLCFLFGIIYYLFFLGAGDFLNLSENADSNLEYLVKNALTLKIWFFIIYVAFGFALLSLDIGLFSLLSQNAKNGAMFVLALGLIWVTYVIAAGMIFNTGLDFLVKLYPVDPERALNLWTAFQTIENGIGGHFEIVSGAWIGFTSLQMGRSSNFPKWAQIFGILVGMAGLATVFTSLAGDIFGLSSMAWFLTLSIILWRSQKNRL